MGMVGETVGLVTAILSLASRIVEMVDSARRSKEQCSLLSEHVQNIRNLLTQLDNQWTPDLATEGVLRSLKTALDDALLLVEACQIEKPWYKRLAPSKKAKKFDALDKRISIILQQFHVANMVLIVNIHKDRFFMTVLKMLLGDGACRNLPERKKNELNSYIRGLTHRDDMSTDAKWVLGWIQKDLADGNGSRFAASIPAEEGSGGGGVSDTLAKEVVQTCELIVQEAGSARQNQGHVQRLKQLAQQVADLMQHPQAYGLTREAETREMVNNLKEVLGDARMIVWYSQQPQRSMIPLPLISCSGGRGRGVEQPAEQILTVVYKMEYYLQVLPVMARRQMVIPESEYGAQAS
nr:hypothetical protein LOC_Os11g44230 [Oryza sativa Japonica Group]